MNKQKHKLRIWPGIFKTLRTSCISHSNNLVQIEQTLDFSKQLQFCSEFKRASIWGSKYFSYTSAYAFIFAELLCRLYNSIIKCCRWKDFFDLFCSNVILSKGRWTSPGLRMIYWSLSNTIYERVMPVLMHLFSPN